MERKNFDSGGVGLPFLFVMVANFNRSINNPIKETELNKIAIH